MSDDDQERCPCCGSRRTVAQSRSFQLDFVRAFACSDCGAQWRHDWKPYLATASLFGGVAVALVAGGSALWRFLAADSETIDGETCIAVVFGGAVALGAGYAAKRGWSFLRSSPKWIVVERAGRDVQAATLSTNARTEDESATTTKSSWRTDWIEGAVVIGFLVLAAIFGTEGPQERSERERRERLRGANGPVVRSHAMLRAPGPLSTPARERPDTDVGEEPFSEEVLETLEAWKKRTPREESDAPYLDDVLQLPSASPLAEGDSDAAAPAKPTLPFARPVLLDNPPYRAPNSNASPDVTDPASVPKD